MTGMQQMGLRNRIVRCSIVGAVLLSACAEEPPPPSVDDYLENRILLEATMVRCAANRAESKYESECVNAREAANRIAAADAAQRRQELEAQSERKRQAVRRAQDAAAEARRRAAEAERLRREAELLGQLPPGETAADPAGERPAAPDAAAPPADAALPPGPGSEPPAAGDLDAVREELRRREQAAGDEDVENPNLSQ